MSLSMASSFSTWAFACSFVQRHLPKQHVAELLAVCAFATEIRQHVPKVAVEIRRPLSVEVLSEVFPECFREKPVGESFTRMVVVMPPCDVEHRLVIYPFHVVCILSGSARQGACLFLAAWCSRHGVPCGKA